MKGACCGAVFIGVFLKDSRRCSAPGGHPPPSGGASHQVLQVPVTLLIYSFGCTLSDGRFIVSLLASRSMVDYILCRTTYHISLIYRPPASTQHSTPRGGGEGSIYTYYTILDVCDRHPLLLHITVTGWIFSWAGTVCLHPRRNKKASRRWRPPCDPNPRIHRTTNIAGIVPTRNARQTPTRRQRSSILPREP